MHVFKNSIDNESFTRKMKIAVFTPMLKAGKKNYLEKKTCFSVNNIQKPIQFI